MTIERVTAGLSLQSGDRFLVLYGANTSDNFCTPDLLLQDIEQVLHQYLLASGYDRILFYSGIKKLYFLDERSRNRTRLKPQAAAKSPPNANAKLQVTPGPLGRKRGLLESAHGVSSQGGQEGQAVPQRALQGPPQTSRLQDVQILPIFETIIQDTTQKSAVVFAQAEDLSQFDNRRELFGRLVDWSRLPPWNRNMCILVFHHENRLELQQFCDRIGFTFLANLAINRNAVAGQVNLLWK